MAIVSGSMNYTTSGRKKKTSYWVRKSDKPVAGSVRTAEPYRRETPNYPSNMSTNINTTKPNDDYKKEISSRYTVAPAYNKGAYQVISTENVKDIGR